MPEIITTPYWRVVLAVLRKDLRAEIRGRELISSMLLFAVMAVLVFSFALELDREARESSVAGVLWVTIVFSGLIGLSRSMAVEKDKGSLDALLIAPIQRSALFFGKMIANLTFTLVIAVMLLVLLTVLFNMTLFIPALFLIILLGCTGFTTAGTLLSSMSIHARSRETLLPIALLPVVLPIILPSVRASTALIADTSSSEWLPWLQMIVLIDLIFVVGTYFLFDFVVEE